MKERLKIEISNIKVSGKRNGSYSFDWKVQGIKKEGTGKYFSSWSCQANSTLRKRLKTGYAIELAIQTYYGF